MIELKVATTPLAPRRDTSDPNAEHSSCIYFNDVHQRGRKPVTRLPRALRTEELASTQAKGRPGPISQAQFIGVLQSKRPARMSDVFTFRRPRSAPRGNASAALDLNESQHDVMYALSGCSDVLSTMGSVRPPIRQALLVLFGIEKQAFQTWFKNRRQVVRRVGDSRASKTIPAAFEASVRDVTHPESSHIKVQPLPPPLPPPPPPPASDTSDLARVASGTSSGTTGLPASLATSLAMSGQARANFACFSHELAKQAGQPVPHAATAAHLSHVPALKQQKAQSIGHAARSSPQPSPFSGCPSRQLIAAHAAQRAWAQLEQEASMACPVITPSSPMQNSSSRGLKTLMQQQQALDASLSHSNWMTPLPHVAICDGVADAASARLLPPGVYMGYPEGSEEGGAMRVEHCLESSTRQQPQQHGSQPGLIAPGYPGIMSHQHPFNRTSGGPLRRDHAAAFRAPARYSTYVALASNSLPANRPRHPEPSLSWQAHSAYQQQAHAGYLELAAGGPRQEDLEGSWRQPHHLLSQQPHSGARLMPRACLDLAAPNQGGAPGLGEVQRQLAGYEMVGSHCGSYMEFSRDGAKPAVAGRRCLGSTQLSDPPDHGGFVQGASLVPGRGCSAAWRCPQELQALLATMFPPATAYTRQRRVCDRNPAAKCLLSSVDEIESAHDMASASEMALADELISAALSPLSPLLPQRITPFGRVASSEGHSALGAGPYLPMSRTSTTAVQSELVGPDISGDEDFSKLSACERHRQGSPALGVLMGQYDCISASFRAEVEEDLFYQAMQDLYGCQ